MSARMASRSACSLAPAFSALMLFNAPSTTEYPPERMAERNFTRWSGERTMSMWTDLLIRMAEKNSKRHLQGAIVWVFVVSLSGHRWLRARAMLKYKLVDRTRYNY